MRFLNNTSTDPYFNLAFDEYCLENVRQEETYFFLWRNRPAVIVGLNQNVFAEVNLQYLDSHGITLAISRPAEPELHHHREGAVPGTCRRCP